MLGRRRFRLPNIVRFRLRSLIVGPGETLGVAPFGRDDSVEGESTLSRDDTVITLIERMATQGQTWGPRPGTSGRSPTITTMHWWQTLIAVAGGLLLLWLGLLAALWVAGRRTGDPASWREALRLLPDVIRLLRRLAADPTLPRGVRIRLVLLLGYLLLPIDLVPDVIPVIGYADDAIIVALALRAIVHSAGPDALARHWPGTLTGLATLHRLARLPGPERPGS